MKFKDYDMSDRLIEELDKIGNSNMSIARRVGCSKKMVSNWYCGHNIPSAFYLKWLDLAGVDILYVITGRRE